MAYPSRNIVAKRRAQSGSQLGFLPAAAIPLASKAVGAVKKLIGSGPDAAHHVSRESAVATALQLARQGRLDAFLWLRAATGGFNAKAFLIPVPPIPELNYAGGIFLGLGDKQAKQDANAAYQSVRALFPQVPEHGNTIATVATGGGGGTQPPAPPTGGGSGGGSAGGGAANDQPSVPPTPDQPAAPGGAGAPQEAGFGMWAALGLLGAAVAVAVRGRRGRGRRRAR